MPKQFVSLQISDEQLVTCDVSLLEREFNPPVLTPRQARQARASLLLTFPKYDQDPREVWEIPEAQAFFQALSRAVPHMAYFIVPHEKVGQILLWLLAVIGAKRTTSGEAVLDFEKMEKALSSMLAVVGKFCIEMRDDPDEVLKDIISGLPPQLRAEP